MSKFSKLLIVSACLFAGLIVFQNCSSKGGGSTIPGGGVITTSTLSILPSSGTVSPSNFLQFTVSGGTPPYTYSILSGAGNISQGGLYSAGAGTGLTTVAATDAAGSTVLAYVTVGTGGGGSTGTVLTIVPASATVTPNGTIQLSAVNGTAPYSYSMHAGNGSVNASGLYTASNSVGSSIVMVTDSTGTKSYSYITVSAGTGTAYTSDGSNQVCCPSGMTATSFTDVGTGRNHGIYINNPSANCCTAWEGSANYGSPACQVTCN
jgi:hypothetical protein